MAVRTVPPTNNYNASGSATGRRERSFAALYEQARRVSGNDNSAKAAANDDADKDAADHTDVVNDQNIQRLDNLREGVNTLRGEIIVRVIQSSDSQLESGQATGDISRLANRLDGLRKKLETEQVRLSGKLIDIKA